MTTTTTPALPTGRPPSRRRWLRRVLIGLFALVVVVVAAVVLYVENAPVPAPLALPTRHTSAPAGPVDGDWQVVRGSEAGYRIEQTVLFATGEVVQRTTHVDGTLTVAGDRITAAAFHVDLTTIASDGRRTPQLAVSLDTGHHPDAAVRLTEPVALPPTFASGATVSARAVGELTLRGVARPVTFTVTARRDGDRLLATGTIPVAFADWSIPSPADYGPFGSLADHGVAEFLLVLSR